MNNTSQDIKTSFWDYSSLLANKVLIMMLAAVSFPIITKLLGVERFAKYNLITLVVDVCTVLLISWTHSSVIRFGKEEYTNTGKVNTVFWTRLFLALIGILIAFIFLILLRSSIMDYIGLHNNLLILLLPIFIFVNMLYEHMKHIYMSVSQIQRSALIESLNRLAYILMLILVFILFSAKEPLILIVFSLNILALSSAIILTLLKLDLSIIFPVKFDLNLAGNLLVFSYPFIFSSSISLVFNYVDVVVIKKFLEMESLGYYMISYKIMAFFRNLIVIPGPVIIPIIIGYYVTGKIGYLKRFYRDIIPVALLIWTVFLTCCLILIRPAMNIVFGSRFSMSVAPAQVLLCGLSVYSLSFFCRGILSTYKKTKLLMLVSVSAGIINIIGDYLLVPRVGIMGAAVSTAISFSYVGFLYYLYGGAQIDENKLSIFLLVLPILAFPLFVFFELNQIVWFVSAMLYYYVMIKLFNIFNKDNIAVLEQIDMPVAVKNKLIMFYGLMANI